MGVDRVGTGWQWAYEKGLDTVGREDRTVTEYSAVVELLGLWP